MSMPQAWLMVRKRCAIACILMMLLAVSTFAQAPSRFHYVRTDQDPVNVIYDVLHKQFYVTVPGTNEVYVVSALNGSVTSKISVTSPYGLDLSHDGSRLYVTSNVTTLGYGAAEGFFVVDTSSLKVIDFVQPTVPVNPLQIFFPNTSTMPRFIAAMSNGKIFYNASQRNSTGSQVFAYDPGTGISNPREPITGSASFYDGTIRKSADASKFAVLSGDSAGGDLWVYDSGSDSYAAYKRIPVNSDAVFNATGTRVLAGGHLLFDQNLNEIVDIAPTAGLGGYLGATFSPDGTKIYVVTNYVATQTLPGGGTTSFSNPVISVYDGSTGQLIGYVPAPRFSTPSWPGIAVSENGVGILLSDRGFAEMDLSHPNPNLPGTVFQSLRYPNVISPPTGNAAAPSSVTVNGIGLRSGANVYFGPNPAISVSVGSSNVINAQPPRGSPGPVDATVSFPDGWTVYAPEAYSYGPTILYQDVNAGDVSGGTTIQIIGYGFDSPSSPIRVTVGGATATVTNVRLSAGISPFTFPFEYLTLTTPPGASGFADVTVTTDAGSTTVKKGFQYLSHRLISGVLPLQMVLDEPRGRLYAADSNTGTVKFIDLNSLSVGTLVGSLSNPATGLAMTPDGGKLLIIDAGGMLTVFDLKSNSVAKTFFATPGNQPTSQLPSSIVATSRATAIVGISPGVFGGGALYEFDLATGNAIEVRVKGPIHDHMLMTSSLDGSRIYIAPDGSDGSTGGNLSLWSSSSDAVVQALFYAYSISQLSTTSLGDRLLADSFTYTPALSVITGIAPNDILVSQRSLVRGEKILSSGSLQYVPTTKGVEIYDVNHGQMLISIGILGGSASTLDALVANHAGNTLYVAEGS